MNRQRPTARRSTRVGVLLLVGAVVLAACGGDNSGSSAGAPTTGAATTAGGSGAATTSAAGAATSTAGAATSGAPATPQPGLTDTSVTVGTVATLTGPVPGALQGAVFGADAYFAMVNAAGGVNGRKIVQKVGDDNTNCATAQSATQGLVGSVFAFVGSMSVFDNCMAKVLQSSPNVPAIGWLINAEPKALANSFDPQFLPVGFETGELQYYKQKFPDAVQHVGILYTQNAGVNISFLQQKQAMDSVGWKIAYSRGYAPTETDLTADVLRMKDSGVQLVWLPDTDRPNTARLMQAAQQQDFHPMFINHEIGYDPQLIKLLGSAAEGLYEGQPWVMFNGEDTATVPAVKTFLDWMKKQHPDFTVDSASLKGWAAAQAFVQALKAAGPAPTQAAILTGFQGMHDFSADGLLAPSDLGNKQPEKCYLVIQYHNGAWQRVAPSSGTGFQCDPTGFQPYKP